MLIREWFKNWIYPRNPPEYTLSVLKVRKVPVQDILSEIKINHINNKPVGIIRQAFLLDDDSTSQSSGITAFTWPPED